MHEEEDIPRAYEIFKRVSAMRQEVHMMSDDHIHERQASDVHTFFGRWW